MIYGPRVRFRRAERSDLPTFTTWLNDPEVRAGISMFLPMGMDEEAAWYQKMLERPQEERIFAVDITDGDGWRLIGSTSFFSFDWRNRSAEFGIMIGEKDCWNQGYGTEISKMMLQHAFETLNLHRVTLRVFADNPRAIRTYEKAGYVLEGTLRQVEWVKGRYIDTHLMSVLRPEWEAARRQGENAGTA